MAGESDAAERRRAAADRHEFSALLHDDAAEYWQSRGDPELAELERRNAALERASAELDRDRADLFEQRAASSSSSLTPEGAAH